MKELITIINGKFQQIIDELRIQKETLETKLSTIRTDIDEKVKIASQYKDKVEKSNKTISEHEQEIEKLKQDLKELHEKFESAGFKEIIEAGNKEINGKIIEFNTLIETEQTNIKNLQEEAQNLKDELITLDESETNIETELNNTIIALNYYNAKIDEITKYAVKNVDRLNEFVPDDGEGIELISTEDIKDADKKVDSKIFEEIDEISTGKKEISDEELNAILNATKEEKKEEVVEEDVSTTQALDEVIDQTNDILAKDKIDEIPLEDDFLSVPQDEDIEEIIVEEDKVEETKEEEPKEEKVEEPKEEEKEVEEVPQDNELENKIREIGLDPNMFVGKALDNLKGNIDVGNGIKILDVLDRHFVDLNNLYTYPNIIVSMKPDVLSHILDKLEETGCTPSTINYVFKYLDKIEVSKLDSIVNGETPSIISVLYECVSELDTKDIGKELGLNKDEVEVLEAHLDGNLFDVMGAFADVVKVNYNALKSLNIAELNKCFTEHPKKFMENPDAFESMLDKYDTDDLVRCINKNVAVIDKL